ncbi:hypothetical protein KKH18_10230 [bacterium]|nr:hypothetical protein [bacterium]
MNRLLISLLLIIGICATASADSNRVLLRPPDNYDGINIGGVPFVMGQVYLPQLADTALLTPFGFRDFQFAGSTSRYKKIKAWWPLNTDVAELPEQVLGLSYEKMTEEDLAYAAIMQPELVPSGMSMNEVASRRFSHMHPADGKPHLIYKDEPYVEGTIFCSSYPDEEQLKKIGIVLYYNFDEGNEQTSEQRGYSRWSAMWPMSLKKSRLPSYIVGIVADETYGRYYDDYASDIYPNRFYGTPSTTTNNYYYSGNCPTYYSRRYQTPRYNSYRRYDPYKYEMPKILGKYGHEHNVEWTPAQRNNPRAYWYNTLSRTTLHPTTIGSYDGNKYLRKVRTYPYYCR